MRLITACDDYDHIDFLPLWSTAWRKFLPELTLTCVIVGDKDRYPEYEKYADIHIVKPIDGFSGAINAKMARLWIACKFGDEPINIEDIDLIPMQREWRKSKIDAWNGRGLMLMGTEVYPSFKGKRAPMSCLTAQSCFLQKIINPVDMEFEQFVRLNGRDGNVEDQTDTKNEVHFSDEAWLGAKLERIGRNNLPIQYIERGYDMQRDTLDRACWDMLDYHKMWRQEYLECHMLKKYKPNIIFCDKLKDVWGIIPGLAPVIDYIGYDEPVLRGLLPNE